MTMQYRSPTGRLARRIDADLGRDSLGQALEELRQACRKAGKEDIGGIKLANLRGVGGIAAMEDALGRERSEFGQRATPVESTTPDVYAKMDRGQLIEELRDLGYRGKVNGRSTSTLLEMVRERSALSDAQ